MTDKSEYAAGIIHEPGTNGIERPMPNASWVHYDYARPIDLSERGAGFIEGFAAACASISCALTGDPDAGKSYDPMLVDLKQGTMFSYVFNMEDGGRSHPLADYKTYYQVANCLFRETLEGISSDPEHTATALRRLSIMPQ